MEKVLISSDAILARIELISSIGLNRLSGNGGLYLSLTKDATRNILFAKNYLVLLTTLCDKLYKLKSIHFLAFQNEEFDDLSKTVILLIKECLKYNEFPFDNDSKYLLMMLSIFNEIQSIDL